MGRQKQKSQRSQSSDFIDTGYWLASDDDTVHFYKQSISEKATSDELHKNNVSHLQYESKNEECQPLETYLGWVLWDDILKWGWRKVMF